MDGIRVTSEQVRKWEKRLAELQAEMESLRQNLAAVNHLARSVGVRAEGADEVDPVAGSDEHHTHSLTQSVRDVLAGAERFQSHAQIRRRLLAAGFPEEKFGKNRAYYYTVIKRLVAQGDLRKNGRKYKLSK